MKKARMKFNIDKLRLCYRQPQQLFDYLMRFQNGDRVPFDGFSLLITDSGRGQADSDKEPTKIKANVILEEGTTLGEFSFNNSAKYEGKCFFSFDNKALYLVAGINDQGKCNYMAYMDYVEEQLNLSKNNLTEVEIACDINFNPLRQFKKLIRDVEHFDMVVNGRRIEENERIYGYGEYYDSSRKRRNRYPTMYFNQQKADSPSIKIYDKLSEIKESGKDYISEWNEFKGKMWRVEITVKNEDFKLFQERASRIIDVWGEMDSVIALLGLEQFKMLLWIYVTERIVYFKEKRGDKKVISLCDIVNREVA